MDHDGLPQCAVIMLMMELASLEYRIRGEDGDRRVSRGHKTGTLTGDMVEPRADSAASRRGPSAVAFRDRLMLEVMIMTWAREVLRGEHSMLVALIDYWRQRSDEAFARSAVAQRVGQSR